MTTKRESIKWLIFQFQTQNHIILLVLRLRRTKRAPAQSPKRGKTSPKTSPGGLVKHAPYRISLWSHNIFLRNTATIILWYTIWPAYDIKKIWCFRNPTPCVLKSSPRFTPHTPMNFHNFRIHTINFRIQANNNNKKQSEQNKLSLILN